MQSREIPGFPGYRVFSDGRIWSKPRLDACNHPQGGLFLKTKPDTQGYLQVALALNGRAHFRRVHRLVASAFLPGFKKTDQVNHIDGDKKNNRIENLEACSSRHNIDHRERVVKGRKRWGVFFVKPSRRPRGYWVAKIRVGGKQVLLGSSTSDPEPLYELYRNAYKTLWGRFPW